jgi:hypothetical protein
MWWLLLRTRGVMRLALRLALALWLGLSRGLGLACNRRLRVVARRGRFRDICWFGARGLAPLRLPGTLIHVAIVCLATRRGRAAQLPLRLGHPYGDAKRYGHEPASE